MNDLALQLLVEKISAETPEDGSSHNPSHSTEQNPAPGLNQNIWILDENLSPSDITYCASKSKVPLTLVCNRFDLQQQLKANKVNSTFNDFDFSGFADNSIHQVFYRISKEKAVVHHIVNQAFRVLKPGGRLIIAGYKNEGAKTYIDKACKLFNGAIAKTKGGQSSHLAIISKASTGINNSNLLDDKEYSLPRTLHIEGVDFISKPGQFGWNKIDKGSEFLIQHLPEVLAQRHQEVESILDLGCGYGYLSLMAASLNHETLLDLKKITATDNNAAAILSCEENLKNTGKGYEVIADDCAQSIRGRFDLVLCNPPFHQGFSIESDLTRRFLEQTQKHLHAKGDALFVVNQFIPLERKATDLFDKVSLLAENKSFKLIHCKR